jgi:hypothetical protein
MVEAEFVESGKVHNVWYCSSVAMYSEIQKVFAGRAQWNVELSYNLLWNVGWKYGFYVLVRPF